MGMQQKNKNLYMYHDNLDHQGQDKRPEGMRIWPLMQGLRTTFQGLRITMGGLG
jgi:hypothetical protein